MTSRLTSVVVLAYGDEPYLTDCVGRVLADDRSGPIEVIVIDNGSPAVEDLAPDPRLRVITPEHNLGYAAGCNLGAAHSVGTDLVFLNSDALVQPGAVRSLVAVLTDPTVGIATGGVRLADAPELMNSVGNPVHYLGVVWAGGYGEPAAAHLQPTDVASASGAFFAVRRAVWQSLDGFDEQYFAYHEDAELSLRTWQRGLRVRFVPDAVVLHHYEFSRNPNKQYLLERNRWITVLTVYPTPVLACVLPAMIAFDLALCAVAAAQGWLPAKLKAWRWLLTHRRDVVRRRRAVQAAATISPGAFMSLLVARIEPPILERPTGLGLLNRLLAGYWGLARHLLPSTASLLTANSTSTQEAGDGWR